jgi:hypothetical protein
MIDVKKKIKAIPTNTLHFGLEKIFSRKVTIIRIEPVLRVLGA